jgi:hypothetical protein
MEAVANAAPIHPLDTTELLPHCDTANPATNRRESVQAYAEPVDTQMSSPSRGNDFDMAETAGSMCDCCVGPCTLQGCSMFDNVSLHGSPTNALLGNLSPPAVSYGPLDQSQFFSRSSPSESCINEDNIDDLHRRLQALDVDHRLQSLKTDPSGHQQILSRTSSSSSSTTTFSFTPDGYESHSESDEGPVTPGLDPGFHYPKSMRTFLSLDEYEAWRAWCDEHMRDVYGYGLGDNFIFDEYDTAGR